MARATIVVLALIEGLWMGFDGTRALTVGDYVTPRSGARAGELGPWHNIVESVGIAPRSVLMKIIFVAFGLAWLIIAVALQRRVPWAVNAALVAAVTMRRVLSSDLWARSRRRRKNWCSTSHAAAR